MIGNNYCFRIRTTHQIANAIERLELEFYDHEQNMLKKHEMPFSSEQDIELRVGLINSLQQQPQTEQVARQILLHQQSNANALEFDSNTLESQGAQASVNKVFNCPLSTRIETVLATLKGIDDIDQVMSRTFQLSPNRFSYTLHVGSDNPELGFSYITLSLG